MTNHNVEIRWDCQQMSSDKGAHSMAIFIHGNTIYQYMDVEKEEAIRRFQEVMQNRNPHMAAVEPAYALAHIIRFDDELCLWLRAGEDVSKMMDHIFGQQ